jgi:hypothetical protein
MPKSNVVAIRDERGRCLKGMPGGPGRPLGSRNKLREDFFADMHAAWLESGREVIDRLIAERPEIFLMAMVKIAQVHRIDLDRPEDFDRPSGRDEALRLLEKRAGPKARKIFDGRTSEYVFLKRFPGTACSLDPVNPMAHRRHRVCNVSGFASK